MARPQLENGHTRIANEILERLMKLHLPPNQWRVLLCIIRKTYGYQRKVDYIANSQIVSMTGLGKTVVSRALHSLSDMNIINRKGKFIGFQKDWEKWRKLAVSSTSSPKLAKQPTTGKLAVSSTRLAVSSTKVSSPAVTQKKKETIQKKVYGEFNNVLLSDEEYQKLTDKFNEAKTLELIGALSEGLASKGYSYKNHYATILSWKRRDDKKNGDKTPRKIGDDWPVK